MTRVFVCLVALLQVACGPLGVGLGIAELFGDDSNPSTVLPTIDLDIPDGEDDPPASNDTTPCFFYKATNRNLSELTIQVLIDGVSIELPPSDPFGSVTPEPENRGWRVCFLRELSAGPHLIQVIVTDKDGNEFEKITRIDVDLDPPAPIELNRPIPINDGTTRELIVHWKVPPEEDLAYVEVFLMDSEEFLMRLRDAVARGDIDQKLLNTVIEKGGVDPLDKEVAAFVALPEAPETMKKSSAGDDDIIFEDLDVTDDSGQPTAYHVYAVAVDVAGNRSLVSGIRGRLLDGSDPDSLAKEIVDVNFPDSGSSTVSAQVLSLEGNVGGVVHNASTGENFVSIYRPVVGPDGSVDFEQVEKFAIPEGAPDVDRVIFPDVNDDGKLDFYGWSVPKDGSASVLSAYRALPDGGFELVGIYQFDDDLLVDEVESIDLNLDAHLDLLVRARSVEAGKPGALVVIRGYRAAAGFGPAADRSLAELDWDDYETINAERDVTRTDLDVIQVRGQSGHFDNDTYTDYVVIDEKVVQARFGTGTTDEDPIAGLPDTGFGEKRISVPNGGPMRMARADFNRDAIMDVVTSNADGTISVLLGRANRVFDLPVEVVVGDREGPLAVGDFNSDGVPDIAVAGAASDTLTILISTATAGVWNGGFEEPLTRSIGLTANATPEELSPADFNRDGRVDFMVTADVGSPRLMMSAPRSNNTPGSFSRSPVLLPTFHPAHSVAVLDANGDGIADVLAGGRHSDLAIATLYRGAELGGTPSGRFIDPQSLGGTGTDVLSLAPADFDRSGIVDVALAGPEGFRPQYGTALRLEAGADYALSDTGLRTITGDFNHDGIPDLASLRTGFIVLHMGRNTDGVADGTFRSEDTTLDPKCGLSDYSPLVESIPVGRRYSLGGITGYEALGAADFDGDGGLDLMVNDSSSAPGLAVLRNFGRACDDLPDTIPDRPGFGQFEKPVRHPLLFKPGRFVIGDMNNDRIPDVVALAKDPGASGEAFCVMLGERDGSFKLAAAVPYSAGTVPVDLAIADLNRDGLLDVVLLDAVNGVYVLLNTGTDGELGSAKLTDMNLPSGAGPMTRVAVGRLDFDVAPDVVVGCQDGVRVLFGDN